MWQNHLKIALRNFSKNRVFSLINLLGLSIGMAASILVFLWVQNEWSFDSYHPNAKRIHRVICHWGGTGDVIDINSIPYQLKILAEERIPGIEEFYLLRPARNNPLIYLEDGNVIEERALAYVSDNWLQDFKYEVLAGSLDDFLADKHNVALTQDQATLYFGTESPLGKTLKIADHDYTVKLILADNPSNSSFQFKTILPLKGYWPDQAAYEEELRNGNYNYLAFFRAAPNFDRASVESQLSTILQEMADKPDNICSTIPLVGMRLSRGIPGDYFKNQKASTVNIFVIIGLIILLTVGLNYINLSTALITKRTKEIGIKKVVGARTQHIFNQIITETVLLSLFAFTIALMIVQFFLPIMSDFVEVPLILDYGNPTLWMILSGVVLISIALAGIYPAILSARFKPIQIIKERAKAQKGVTLRKVLVVTQFTSVIIVLICTMIIYQQLNYIQHKEVGYDRDQVMRISPNLFRVGDWRENYDKYVLFKEALEKLPVFTSVAMTDSPISDIRNRNSGGLSWEGKPANQHINIAQFRANAELQEVFGLELSQGRWFDENLNTDDQHLIVNEAAVKRFGIPEPVIGRKSSFQGRKGQIIGVVKDFHFSSLRNEIEPLVIWHNDGRGTNIMARVNGADASNAIVEAKKLFAEFVPGVIFKYNFLDDEFDRMHLEDQKIGTLFQVFASLLIFISCLGLLGLAVFAADRRVKEIGVRKVLGASIASIVSLLSRDFLKLVLIAFLIAVPIAWYAMNQWLANFAYHTAIQWWIFLLAGTLALGVALLTLSPLSIKAAMDNPLDSLRNE